MAAQSNILREFLISLGFRIDQPALQNFIGGISQATKAAIGLGAAVEAMAASVVIGIQKFASNLEQLYFASLRTSSSATNLMAFDRAMQNFGANAGEGVAMVEQLAHLMRTNPGNTAYLEHFIGPVKRLKDGSIDAENALERLGKSAKFLNQPDFVKYQIGAQFGLSDAQVMRLVNGDFSKELARVRAEVSQLNLEKATADAHDFMVVWRDFTIILQQFGIQVYDALSKKLGMGLKDLRDWVQQHGPELADRVATALKMIIDLATIVGPVLLKVIGWFEDLDKKTNGWSTTIIAIIALLKVFGGFEIISGVIGLATAFGSLGVGIVGALGPITAVAFALSGVLDLVKAITGAGPGGAGTWINSKIEDSGFSRGLGEFLNHIMAISGSKGAQEAWATSDPLGFLMQAGHLSREQATGLLANFKAESGLNPTAKQKGGPGFGIGQWEGDRQADFKSWSGHDIHGSGLAEQMLFSMHEMFDESGKYKNVGTLLRGVNNSSAAADLISRQYEKPKDEEFEAANRARIAAQIDQQNTYHIDGSKDPQATGRAVEAANDRSNAKLARSFSTSMK